MRTRVGGGVATVLAAAAFFATGCLEIDCDYDVDARGGQTVTLRLSVGERWWNLLQPFGRVLTQGGYEVTETRSSGRATLKGTMRVPAGEWRFPRPLHELPVTFDAGLRNYLLWREYRLHVRYPLASPGLVDEAFALGGRADVRFSVQLPGEVIDTNATSRAGPRLVWTFRTGRDRDVWLVVRTRVWSTMGIAAASLGVLAIAVLLAYGRYRRRVEGRQPPRYDVALRERRAVITWLLLTATAAAFAGLEAAGGSERSQVLVDNGANFFPLVNEGEVWRLATSVFLHSGWLHLLLNGVALWQLGTLVERLYGPVRFAAAFLACGLAGSLASYLGSEPGAVSVGASGAIFGLAGMILVFGLRHRKRMPPRVARAFILGMLPVVLINFAYGMVATGIDQWAHAGGLAGGVLLAILVPARVSFDEALPSTPSNRAT